MSDIITADNLPLVITALLTGAAGLAVWRHGGKLGDQAKHLAPAETPTTGGVALTNDGAQKIADPLWRIAELLEAMLDDTKAFRAQRIADTLEEVRDGFKAMMERERRP